MELEKVLNVQPILEPRAVGLCTGWSNERHIPGVLQGGARIDRIDPEGGSVVGVALEAVNLDERRRAAKANGGDFRDTCASDCDDLNDIRVVRRGGGLRIGIE